MKCNFRLLYQKMTVNLDKEKRKKCALPWVGNFAIKYTLDSANNVRKNDPMAKRHL